MWKGEREVGGRGEKREARAGRVGVEQRGQGSPPTGAVVESREAFQMECMRPQLSHLAFSSSSSPSPPRPT